MSQDFKLIEIDKKAKRILTKTFWGAKGWHEKTERKIPEEEFEYAISKGLMFNPLERLSHDKFIVEILIMRGKIDDSMVAKAFLASLASRRLDLRSSLASYFMAKNITSHQFSGEDLHCQICSGYEQEIISYHAHRFDEKFDESSLNVLSFERHKWGGVRHSHLDYIWFDLREFLKTYIPEPSTDDITIFQSILHIITTSAPSDYPSTLEKRLKDVLPSSKNERQQLIEILACIGVLKPQTYNRPIHGRNDWVFVEYWRGEDGYNPSIVEHYFGKWLT